MAKSGIYWRILAACFAVMLLATGCFQSIGDEAQPNAVSQARPSETPIPSETPTETATLEDLMPLALSETPTETPTPTATATATATATITPTTALDRPVSDIGGGIVEQDPNQPDDGQLDPWELTATMIVLEITQTVEVGLTQTAQALGLGFPTETPTPFPVIGATPTPPIAQPTSFVSTGNCVHEVVVGENLFRLSMRYGVSIADLASASGITNIQLILVGQKIVIPGCGTTGVLPPPTSLPTQDLTSQNFGTGGAVTAQTAGTAGTGTTTTIARTHTVQQYETLFEISLLYGVSVSSIANANGISNPNFVLMGTVLNIPSQ
jgi:LysM repeat protein